MKNSMRQHFWSGSARNAGIIAVSALLTLATGQSIAGPVPMPNLPIPKPAAAAPQYVPGEVVVRFAQGVSAQSQSGILSQMASTTKAIGGKNTVLVKLNGAYATVDSAVQSLSGMPGVVSVQPNYIYRAQSLPNDPSFNQQWALQNTGQTVTNPQDPGNIYATDNPGIPGDDIGAERAWGIVNNTTGTPASDCSSVTVAVLDTGINYTHQDLAANMWDGSASGYPNHGYDFYSNDNDPMPDGGAEQHGTHVAGIIGAAGNNGNNGSGVCQKAKIMSVRVLGPDGAGTTASIINGVEFAIQHGAKVINMSLSGSVYDPLYESAVKDAQAAGVIIVAAAGNSAYNNDIVPAYPCNFTEDNIICVAAVDQSFNMAGFSDYGATSVDVGAPGTNIVSTWGGTYEPLDFLAGSGWQYSSATTGWTPGSATSSFGATLPLLTDPANMLSSTASYPANADDRGWVARNMNLIGIVHAAVTYSAYWNLGAGDVLNVALNNSGSDPFNSGLPGYITPMAAGSIGSNGGEGIIDLNACIGASLCSFGFQMTSDATGYSGQNVGAYIYNPVFQTQQTGSTSMETDNGTSMAAPVVTGIVAMVESFDPTATYQQVIQAVEKGGRSVQALSGKTTTGKVVSAIGALAQTKLELSGLSNVQVTAGTPQGVSFKVGALNNSLSVTATSDNQGMLPDASISGLSSCVTTGQCNLTLTTSSTTNGVATVLVTVHDIYGQAVSGSFQVSSQGAVAAAPSTIATTSTSSGGGGGAMSPWMLLLAGLLLLPSWLRNRKTESKAC